MASIPNSLALFGVNMVLTPVKILWGTYQRNRLLAAAERAALLYEQGGDHMVRRKMRDRGEAGP